MKQYQFKLSPDFKRITARELPDFKERYLRDPKLDRLTSEKSTLRFSKEIVVSNVADLKWRKSLLRLIGTRLRDAKRNQNTSEIERLQEMQTEPPPSARCAWGCPSESPCCDTSRYQDASPSNQAKARPQRSASNGEEAHCFAAEIRDLADIESQLFGVIHKSPKIFTEYCGRFPTPDDIIHNAVILRCLESGKPHLILPKLAAMFPEYYVARLAEEVKRDPKARRVVHRINAGQIKGEYYDPIERLIAENYFDSSKLPKPLCRLSRDEAVEKLEKHFQKRITVDKYRRHVKSLFLKEYS